MAGVYRPRHLERTVLHRVLLHHFDGFLTEYESRFEREYGFFRPIVEEVVERYLDCGNPRCGFARIPCPELLTETTITPGVIAAIQTFGDRINLYVHLHFLVTEGKVGYRSSQDGTEQETWSAPKPLLPGQAIGNGGELSCRLAAVSNTRLGEALSPTVGEDDEPDGRDIARAQVEVKGIEVSSLHDRDPLPIYEDSAFGTACSLTPLSPLV